MCACVNGAGSFQIAWHFPCRGGIPGIPRGRLKAPATQETTRTPEPSPGLGLPRPWCLGYLTKASCSPGSHGGQSCLWPSESNSFDHASPAKFGSSSGFSCVGWWSLYSVSCLASPHFQHRAETPVSLPCPGLQKLGEDSVWVRRFDSFRPHLAWLSVPWTPPAQGSSPTQSYERERIDPMVRKVRTVTAPSQGS